MPIEWNDNIKTGISVIDDQHQELLVMLNRLGRFRCGRENFLEALDELLDYSNKHFKTEEYYMIDIKYPEYAEHKFSHDKFITDLDVLHKKIENSDDIGDLGDELFHFSESWIIAHYSDEDVKLADYIKKHS